MFTNLYRINKKKSNTGEAFVIELKNLSNVYKYLTLSLASFAASVIFPSFEKN
jgi:hypothetical protein